MVVDDDEIEDSRVQDQALTVGAKREASERKKILKIFSRKALQAKRAKDARAYGELLRRLKIPEDSEEWKNAWKYFYSG
jgi:formiminotetrahydrofolate cyclodeaminase